MAKSKLIACDNWSGERDRNTHANLSFHSRDQISSAANALITAIDGILYLGFTLEKEEEEREEEGRLKEGGK